MARCSAQLHRLQCLQVTRMRPQSGLEISVGDSLPTATFFPPFPSFSSIHLVRYNTQLLHLLGDKAAIVVIPSLSRLVDPLAYTSAFPYAPVDIHSLTSTRLRTAPNVYRRSSDHLNQVHTPTRPCPTSSLVSRQNLDYQFWYAFLVGN